LLLFTHIVAVAAVVVDDNVDDVEVLVDVQIRRGDDMERFDSNSLTLRNCIVPIDNDSWVWYSRLAGRSLLFGLGRLDFCLLACYNHSSELPQSILLFCFPLME